MRPPRPVHALALVGESTAERPCRHTTYLVLAEESFADFELALEFQFDVGNSGVQSQSERVGTRS